jgi:DNA primase
MTLEEMELVLERLGMEVVTIRGSEIQSYCPAHKERTGKEDRNPSWFINFETGAHICFSCDYRGSLNGLTAYVKDMKDEFGFFDYDAAKKWLAIEEDLSAVWERTQKVLIETDKPKITEAALKSFVSPPIEALKARGLLLESALKYELLWDKDKDNWIIPIRDPYTKVLIGWQEKGFATRSFNNFPPGMVKSDALFGFNQFDGERMIVVESPLDVVRLDSVGITGGVAVFGAIISNQQVKLIKSAKQVFMAMDNDEAGKKSSIQMLKLAKEKGFEVWFFNYKGVDVKDVGAMSKSEVVQGLETARHSLHGEKAIV